MIELHMTYEISGVSVFHIAIASLIIQVKIGQLSDITESYEI